MTIKKIIFCIIGSFIMLSCEKDLDYNEFVDYQKEEIFSSFSRTGEFVNNIYSRLDYDFSSFGSGAMYASACDEAEFAWTASDVHDFHNGAWGPINAKAGMWSTAYTAIRTVNFYLDAAQGRTFDQFKHNKDYQEQMTRFERYQYEVRFIRAYFYFNLVRQFGDVPFITEVLTEKEVNSLLRTDKQEIFNFIISECDAIVDHLPVVHDSPYAQSGRVGKIAVLALKARTLLYNASPLFNTANNSKLWEEAAKANKKVIDEAAANGIKLGKYNAIWGTDNYQATEVIFARRVGDLSYLEENNFPVGVEGGRSGNCPTQTLVDAYGMKSTGLAWNEEGSGYNPNNPYNDRDPRFALTIAKNGDTGWPAYNANPLETFVGGLNGAPLAGATPTGYYLKKYLDSSVDLRPGTSNSKRHSWITFRLAEFYLNYAEAMFNLTGSADGKSGALTMTATEAINVVRGRESIQMPNLPIGLSNDDFEKKYMDERMVELAFEGHRFWDVRRWKKGELFKSIDRMILKKNDQGGITYERQTVKRQWDDKMYFFPIPDSELRKNLSLTQNTGW